ncbi:GntR family transcriptional regulator [Neobacillus cucumis]
MDNGNRFGESLPEQIAKHILTKIMKGDLVPGDKIVEDAVATELQTSRAPVREALYLLQVDNIVERIPRKGTVVKSLTSLEIREYTEVMIGLIQMALDFSKDKWTAERIENLTLKLESMTEMFAVNELLGYQQKATLLTNYLFEVAENKALSKFYRESVYILNVFAQVKWTIETMNFYHHKMQKLIHWIKENDIEKAKEIIPDLLLETLD